MNDLPLELLEMVLMRSFMMLYLSDYETDDYVHSTTDDDLPYITAKSRRVEHRPFTLLSSVCSSWYQTMTGWPESPTPAWLRHQLKNLIQCQCTYIHHFCVHDSIDVNSSTICCDKLTNHSDLKYWMCFILQHKVTHLLSVNNDKNLSCRRETARQLRMSF